MLSFAECCTVPALFLASQVKTPPSSTLTRLMLTCETTSPWRVTYWPIKYLKEGQASQVPN